MSRIPQWCLDAFRCPKCKDAVQLDSDSDLARLSCLRCRGKYSIISGVPHFAMCLNEQEATAATFGFEWKAFSKGMFDRRDVFGLNVEETADYFLASLGLESAGISGKRILDAGTGSGRIPYALRNRGALVVAVDIHRSLPLVRERMRDVETCCFVQGDLLELPFPDEYFDIVWSSGVLHHTPNTEEAFHAIAAKVKHLGHLFVSVYARELHHYRLFRKLLPFARYLPPSVTYGLAALLAVPLYVVFNIALLVLRLMASGRRRPYRFLGFRVENIEAKSYRSILLNLFDQLHPRFQHEHTVDEVRGWFEAHGFTDIVPTETVGMVAMRGVRCINHTGTP